MTLVFRFLSSLLRSMPFAFFVFPGLIPFLAFSSFAQDSPVMDSSEISRDLLYVAPSHVEIRSSGDVVRHVFAGRRFEYAPEYPDPGHFQWGVRPFAQTQAPKAPRQKGVYPIDFAATGVSTFELVSHSDDERATLALRRKSTQKVVAEATVWTREQLLKVWLPELRKQKPELTAEELNGDLEVADPEVRDVVATPQGFLVALGYSHGESELGLGSIVSFDTSKDIDAGSATVVHPKSVVACEVTAISTVFRELPSTVPGHMDVWLGSQAVREGVIQPCAGLTRLDSAMNELDNLLPGKIPLLGSVVNVIYLFEEHETAIVTDAGFCTFTQRTEDKISCERFVPTVTLTGATPLSNRPGDKPSGNLKPGDYEVLWANQNYLEVATADSFDAWLAADDYAEAAANHFDTEPYKLLNTSNGGPAPIRPLDKPNGEPLHGALVYRAPLEKLPTPPGTPAGWARIRARVGWIPRGKLEVFPKLVPSEK